MNMIKRRWEKLIEKGNNTSYVPTILSNPPKQVWCCMMSIVDGYGESSRAKHISNTQNDRYDQDIHPEQLPPLPRDHSLESSDIAFFGRHLEIAVDNPTMINQPLIREKRQKPQRLKKLT